MTRQQCSLELCDEPPALGWFRHLAASQRLSMSSYTSMVCALQAITRLWVSLPLASKHSQLVPPRSLHTSQVCVPFMWYPHEQWV